MTRTAAFAAALMLSAAPAFAQTTCTTSTPVDVPILQSAIDAISNGGANDGSYNFAGTADCPAAPSFDASDALAVASALSMPVWLGDNEKFAISGGLGFSEDATALGATGVFRINQNLAAFAGGAVSTEHSDVWAGKAGLRVGW